MASLNMSQNIPSKVANLVNQLRHISYLPFPVKMSRGQVPNTIYCGGLDTKSKNPSLPPAFQVAPLQQQSSNALLEHVTQRFVIRGYSFTQFNNEYFHEEYEDKLQALVSDIVLLIDRFHESFGPQNLLGAGTAAQATLLAALERKNKVSSIALCSPSVGINMQEVHRLNGHLNTDLLRQLSYISKHCPVNTMAKIELNMPVFVMHNINDKIIPYDNVVKLVEKLPAGKSKMLLNNANMNDNENNKEALDQLIDMLLDTSEHQYSYNYMPYSTKSSKLTANRLG